MRSGMGRTPRSEPMVTMEGSWLFTSSFTAALHMLNTPPRLTRDLVWKLS